MGNTILTRPTSSQRAAARVVGAAYLIALPFAIFPEFYIPRRLYGATWTETGARIAGNLALFRVGIASSLLVFTIDVVLICALFEVLGSVRRGIALCALVFRVIETTLLLGVVVNDVSFARQLTESAAGAAAWPDVAAATALSITSHANLYALGLFFAGAGSLMFGILWMRSSYVPRPLALLGIAASTVLLLRQLLWVIEPTMARAIGVTIYGTPIFAFELLMGGWLLIAGIRTRSGGMAASLSPE